MSPLLFHTALLVAHADRIQVFFPTARNHLPKTIWDVLTDDGTPAADRAAILGGAATTCLMFASELVTEDTRSPLEPAVRSIFDMVALNARDLAAEGTTGMQKLERRIGHYMLGLLLEDEATDDPEEFLNLVMFWTIVSVARGVLEEDQKTGAEMAVASLMIDKFDLPSA